MPPRRHNRFDDDPNYSTWRQLNTDENGNLARGYLQHREIAEQYESAMDMDRQEQRQFWADYSWFMTPGHGHIINDPDSNPFWRKYNIDPERNFDWGAWREAIGDSPTRR